MFLFAESLDRQVAIQFKSMYLLMVVQTLMIITALFQLSMRSMVILLRFGILIEVKYLLFTRAGESCSDLDNIASSSINFFETLKYQEYTCSFAYLVGELSISSIVRSNKVRTKYFMHCQEDRL